MSQPSSKYQFLPQLTIPPLSSDHAEGTQMKRSSHSPATFSFNSAANLLENSQKPISHLSDQTIPKEKRAPLQVSDIINRPIQYPYIENIQFVSNPYEKPLVRFDTTPDKENDPNYNKTFSVHPSAQRSMAKEFKEFESPFSARSNKSEIYQISDYIAKCSKPIPIAEQHQTPIITQPLDPKYDPRLQVSPQFNTLESSLDKTPDLRKGPSNRYQNSSNSKEELNQRPKTPQNSEQRKGEDPCNTSADMLNTSGMSRGTCRRRTKPIVVMNIDIGDGSKAELKIFENENPEEVAHSFCQKYFLPLKVVPVLTKNILSQVNSFYSLKSERRKSSLKGNQSTPNVKKDQSSPFSQERTGENIKHLEPPREAPFTSKFYTATEHSRVEQIEETEEDSNFTEFENKSFGPAHSDSQTPRSDPNKEKYEKWMNLLSSRNLNPSAKKAGYSPAAALTESQKDFFESVQKSALKRSQSVKLLARINEHDDSNEVNSQFRHARDEIFQRLYEQGFKTRQQKEEEEAERHRLREEETLRGATFHPKISTNSALLAQQRNDKVEVMLLREGLLQKSRREKMAAEKYDQELSRCTFHPEIDSSQRISSARNTIYNPIYHRLYEDALAKVERQRYLENDQSRFGSFKPELSKLSMRLVGDRSRQPEPTYDRLYKHGVMKQKSLSQKREKPEEVQVYDEITGQRLYQPVINKNPKYYNKQRNPYQQCFRLLEESLECKTERNRSISNKRNTQNQLDKTRTKTPTNKSFSKSGRINNPVGTINSKRNEKVQPEIIHIEISRHKNKVIGFKHKDQNQNSKKSLHDQPTKDHGKVLRKGPQLDDQDSIVLYEIFKMLDSDNDGKISADNFDVSEVPKDIYDCIYDILLALEDELFLTFDDFKRLAIFHHVIPRLKGPKLFETDDFDDTVRLSSRESIRRETPINQPNSMKNNKVFPPVEQSKNNRYSVKHNVPY